MRKVNQATRTEHGFTIIELMIATTVLSVILLLVSSVMVSLGNLYYKGINQARIQDAVRSTTDEVSQQLELSSATPIAGHAIVSGNDISVYCIGNTRYSYVLGSNPGLPHVSWRDITDSNCDPSAPADLSAAHPSGGHASGGADLVPPNSILTVFCIGAVQPDGSCTFSINSDGTGLASPYNLAIGMAYGTTDLLSGTGINTQCIIGPSDRFCATASLSTTIASRLSSGLP